MHDKPMHDKSKRSTSPAWAFSLRAALMAALTAAVLLPSFAAHAEDDDGEALDNKIFRQVLEGLGLRPSDKNIDYRERSPLVVPPDTATLPPPEATGAQASVPANWPVDQDVKRARQAKAEARKARYLQNDSVVEDGRLLRPDELERPAARARRGSDANHTTKEESERPSSPSALGYVGNLFTDAFKGKDDEVVVFRGEPERESLTAPPSGYQTPSPTQPYGLTGTRPLPKAEGKHHELQR
ncbi:MAG TPA: hypothetical protein VNQ56_18685 [Pseudolabrys sp.]|nr:hypothetical protein [Pseudolabrys sp.]